jgi:hypothetical protein
MGQPRVVAVATAVLVSVMSVAGAVARADTPVAGAATPTTVRQLTPLDSSGAVSAAFTVTAHFTGATCISGSPTTGSTYECTTPASSWGVYEACWVTAQTGYVVCLTAPWARTLTRLQVTGGFDDTSGLTRPARPWGVRLATGQRCLLDLDATSTTKGHANTYFCTKKTVLVGAVDRSHKVWRAQAYRRLDHGRIKSLGRQPIALAWRTGPTALDTAPPG